MKNFNLIFVLLLFAIYPNLKSIGQCTPVPINDSPCMTDPNPPYDLGYDGYANGTTCCAVGYNDDPNKDIANQECGSSTNDDAVWYRASIDPNINGIMLNITSYYNSVESFNHGVEIYAGTEDAICDGTADFIKAFCEGEAIVEKHIGCLEGYKYVFIKVSSSESNCSEFYINVFQDWTYNAEQCNQVKEKDILFPETNEEPTEVCISNYLNPDFCPSVGLNACEVFETNSTTWYKIVTDEDANELFVNVTTSGNWTPVWAVFGGDCENLEVLIRQTMKGYWL